MVNTVKTKCYEYFLRKIYRSFDIKQAKEKSYYKRKSAPAFTR